MRCFLPMSAKKSSSLPGANSSVVSSTSERETRLLKSYLYLGIEGTKKDGFDPDDITRHTAVDPWRSWRCGDPAPTSGRKRTKDHWSVHSPAGLTASLTEQADAICALLDSNKNLRAALKPHAPFLNYAIETTTEPREFQLSSALVRNLVRIGAEVDCDLYWVCDPQVRYGLCVPCGVRVPEKLAELQSFIGGERRAAECQFAFTVSGIRLDEAFARFHLDPEDNCRRLGDDGMDIVYLEPLACLQFSSDVLPCSGYVRELEPERLARRFLRSLERHVGEFASADHQPKLHVRFVERGDYQGTAGLHFDRRFLRDVSALNAGIAVKLSYLPDPHFNRLGDCVTCGSRVLGT